MREHYWRNKRLILTVIICVNAAISAVTIAIHPPVLNVEACQEDGTIPPEQFVEVRVITGIDGTMIPELKADIAKGQNTGIAVKDQSIFDTQGLFEDLKELTAGETWAKQIAWRESDTGEFDVRDLIAVLETMNVIDFPNDSGTHPISAYEKWSIPLSKYADDFKKATDTDERKYATIEPILLEGLHLYDRIRHDFRDMYNAHVSAGAGRLRIVEEAPARLKTFAFPFSKQPPSKYRLTKGAAFPILGAFRNCVVYDEKKKRCVWRDGFGSVISLWEEMGPSLVEETARAVKEVGRHPDVLGKSRQHWVSLHRFMENHMLRQLNAALTSGKLKK